MTTTTDSQRQSSSTADLLGSQTPRVGTFVDPAAPSRGPLMEAIAELAGIQFDPWQSLVGHGSLAIRPDIIVVDPATGQTTPRWLHRVVVGVLPRQNGKTTVLKARILTGLYAIPTDRRITHTAQDRAVPREAFEEIAAAIGDTKELHRRLAKRRGIVETNGREQINLKDGSKYVIKAPTPKVFHGPPNDLIIIDELRFQDTDLWGSGYPSQSARPNPQIWGWSNAGNAQSVQLAKLQKRGRAAVELGNDPEMYYVEWSAHRERKPDDPAAWVESNPALGRRITVDTIRDELVQLEPDDFETERLSRTVESVTAPAYPFDQWMSCAGEPDKITADALPRPHLGVHVSGDRTYAAVALAAERDGRLVADVVKRWINPDGVSTTDITAFVLATMKQYRITELAYARRRAAIIADRVAERGYTATRVDSTEWIVATQNLEDAIQNKRLIHRDAAELTQEVRRAGRRTHRDGTWELSEQNSGGDITGLVATMFAVTLAYKQPTTSGGFRTWIDG